MVNVRMKGYLAEREVSQILEKRGIDAYRVPLSGASDHFKGDVIIHLNDQEFVAEVKIRANAFKEIYELLEEFEAISCEKITVTTLSRFLERKELKIHPSKFSITQIERWLDNKDLLFFRANRREWLVAFRGVL